ncbi:MAG: hypothetical protein RDU14_17090 [Melioribacteraceae bacterium]|nr:hypothetical protein [Melioribacteraceae bacterium]
MSQTKEFYSKIDSARTLINSGRIEEGLEILIQCEKSFPDNIHVIRLYGQALYWNKSFDKTIDHFNNAIKKHPELSVLKLDYGRILFELNKLEEAEKYLLEYLETDHENVESQLMLASIYYWLGKPPQRSFSYLYPLSEKYPDNNKIMDLVREIESNTSPYVRVLSGYYNDTQPVRFFKTRIETGLYLSSLFQPSVSFESRFYQSSIQIQSILFHNDFKFPAANIKFTVSGGMIKYSWSSQLSFVGSVAKTWEFVKNINLSLGYERMPYLYTLRSLQRSIIHSDYIASLNWGGNNNWNGSVTYCFQDFDDNNDVRTFSMWFLVPLVDYKMFQFDIGYAFHLADSKEDRFILDNQSEHNNNPSSIGNLPGIYDPYYTPRKQQTHTLLFKVNLNLSEKFNITLNNNIGFLSKIENPDFLKLETNNPVPAGSKEVIKVFSTVNYYPFNLNWLFDWMISDRIRIKGEFSYLKTVYYESRSISAGVKLNFW